MTLPPNVITLRLAGTLGATPPPPVQRGQWPRVRRGLALSLTLISLGAGLAVTADRMMAYPGMSHPGDFCGLIPAKVARSDLAAPASDTGP